jgi:hypothetical protein
LFQKRIYSIFLGTLVGKPKQTIFKKRWFDITSSLPIYAGRQAVALTQHLHKEMTTPSGEYQQGKRGASYCRLCRAKTGLVYNFVDVDILSTPIFCGREYFVDANILSMQIFCRRLYFVDAKILSTLIFCRCRGFSRRLYFSEFIANHCVCINIMIINLFKPS